MRTSLLFVFVVALLAAGCAAPLTVCATPVLATYVDPLPIPSVVKPVYAVWGDILYTITMTQFNQKLHRDLAPTPVWGYNGTFPGPTIDVRRNLRVVVRWVDNLPTTHLLAIDHTIHGAELIYPDVRNVVHLHGGHVPPESDGGPEAWYVPGAHADYVYPNIQRGSTLWYHDHALGITRLNVYAGLAGFYLIRDNEELALGLPSGSYEIPIVIQDRSFNDDGSLLYPAAWEPEFFGDFVLVNGKVWPALQAEPRKYRFRMLNGSGSRFYRLKLVESTSLGVPLDPQVPGPAMNQIGAEGGLLNAPVVVNPLLIAPGERADLVIDFTGKSGKYYVFVNDAETPYQKGLTTDGAIPQIMQFKITKPLSGKDTSKLPSKLSTVVRIPEGSATNTRDLTLEEKMMGGRMTPLLDGLMWSDPVTETPHLGDTEIWRLVNLTTDTHPIHLHDVMYQVLDRIPFDAVQYALDEASSDLQPLPHYYSGPPVPPDPNEMGWKDTVRASPEMVTRIIMRFEDFTGHYMWHCHILEHEENEMMRPMDVLP